LILISSIPETRRRGADLRRRGGNVATATKRMLDSYKPALRQYLVANKIMDTKAFTTIPGSVIIGRFGYPRGCEGGGWEAGAAQ
jgi:hypothetical protein